MRLLLVEHLSNKKSPLGRPLAIQMNNQSVFSRRIHVFAVITGFAFLTAGCARQDKTSETNLELWHSPIASLENRKQAASHLVSKGTAQGEAEQILGKPSYTIRFHGPVIYAAPGYVGPTNVTHTDVWCDYYDFGKGDYVCLTFDVDASRTKWEMRPLLNIAVGNTNRDWITIPTTIQPNAPQSP